MGQAIIPGNFKIRYNRGPYDSSSIRSHAYTLQSTGDVLGLGLGLGSLPFLSILAHFLKPKLSVTFNRI